MGLGGFSHGRNYYVALDDLDGALSDISSVVRNVAPSLTSPRPDTTGLRQAALRYQLLGQRDFTFALNDAFFTEGGTTKIHGRNVKIALDQYEIDADISNGTIRRAVNLDHRQPLGNTWRRRQIVGQRSGSISFQGLLNTTAGRSYPVGKTLLGQETPAFISIPYNGWTIGNLADIAKVCLGTLETPGGPDAPNDVNGEFMVDDLVDLGVVLHGLSAETGVTNFASVDESEQTIGAAFYPHWVAHIHVTAIAGGTGVVIRIQDSADNSTFADLTGASQTVNAVGGFRLEGSATATVRRYVRAVIQSMGTATSITFSVVFARRDYAFGAAGSYRHFAGLLGRSATSTFQLGPEGNATGAERITGECRMQSLDMNFASEEPLRFSAAFGSDSTITTDVF